MKKLLAVTFVLLFCFVASGCQSLSPRVEINELTVVRVLGVDKTDNGVRLSITNVKPGDAVDATSTPNYLISEGATVYEAMAALNATSTKRPFWAFLEYIIISVEVAKSGLSAYLDVFIREYDLRLNINVFILRGNTCEEVVVSAIDRQMYLSNYFNELVRGIDVNSLSSSVTLADIANSLYEPHTSMYVPVVYMSPNNMMNIKTDDPSASQGGNASSQSNALPADVSESVSESEKENIWFLLEGYAIFRDDRLCAYTDKMQTIGMNILLDEYKAGVVTVADKRNNRISLRIMQLYVTQKPESVNGRYSVSVTAEADCSVAEYMGHENIFTDNYMKYVSEQVDKYFADCIKSAVEFAHENRLDCIRTGETFRLLKPYQWRDMKENWLDGAFRDVTYRIAVDTVIRHSYSVLETNPIGG